MLVLIIIQFITPQKNIAEGISENDISKVYDIPADIHRTLVYKCYDCHSNNTQYPWYSHIQPVGWWLAGHIEEGKEHLNFSEFKTYSDRRAAHKLEELAEVIEEESMPLKSYMLMHPDTKFTPEEARALKDWLKSLASTAGQ